MGKTVEGSLTPEHVVAFCGECDWTHEAWSVHRAFQDTLPTGDEVVRKHGCFLKRLSHITQEYSLLQICKLHDPAVQGSCVNLTVDYIWRAGTWKGETRERLMGCVTQLTRFYQVLAPARRKLLAHNDREVKLQGKALGGFEVGADDVYFSVLQDFASVVHSCVVGGPFTFSDLARSDTESFVTALTGRGGAHITSPQPTNRGQGGVE